MSSGRTDDMEKENTNKEITLDTALPQSASNCAKSSATNNGFRVKNVSEINDAVNCTNSSGGISERATTNKRKFSTPIEEEENKENGGNENLSKNKRNKQHNVDDNDSSDAENNQNQKKSKLDENLKTSEEPGTNENDDSAQQISGATTNNRNNSVDVLEIINKREEVGDDVSSIEIRTGNTNKSVEIKVEPTSIDENASSSQSYNVSVPKPLLEDVKELKTEAQNNDTEASCSHSNSGNELPLKLPVKVEKAEASSTTRKSCRYGIRCYRQNIIHRQLEAHPGDVDYTRPNYPPPPNGTPPCPYGSSCYRRNPCHFQKYTHPPNTDVHNNHRNHRNQQPLPYVSSYFYDDETDSDHIFSDSGSEYLEFDEISSESEYDGDYDDCDRAEE